MSRINVFILAAGLGERLRPITEYIPKPFIPILGKPVLQSILEKVSTLPVNKIGINLYHKKELINDWIIQSDFRKMVELFPEDPILGTGGALKNAEAFLSSNTFLVHNSDILSDINLEELLESHHSSGNLVTLAVHDYSKFNKLEIDEQGFLKGILRHPRSNPPPSMGKGQRGGRTESKTIVAFTGIAVYSPEFLKFLPQGVSSIVDAWFKAVAAGYKIGTLDITGCYWTDIGTPSSYAKAVIEKLRKNGEMVYIHPSIDWCKHIELDGYVVIEKGSNAPSPPFSKGVISDVNVLNKGTSLRNCIVLPGTKIEIKDREDTAPECLLTIFWKGGTGEDLQRGSGRLLSENCILGPGFKIDLSESEIFEVSGEGDAILIGTGGSDIRYYRVKIQEHTEVLMKCAAGDTDFQRHIEYTRFFKRHSIPVPELIDVEPGNISAFFEDLGDLSLYNWLKCPREQEEIEKVYKKVIDILTLIHTKATKHVSECHLLKNRVFDYEYLRWETGYFIERFVEGVRNIRVKNLPLLNNEVHRLAVKADSFPKTVIHRDFQSQNIMITKGGIPRLLDYQGARIGPPAYDVVSILWDPYYRLEENLRGRLLNYYIRKIIPPNPLFGKGGQGGILEKEFRETLLPCRLQRHMQALGAYGFLSTVKGKKYFLKHVPEGLRLLKEDVSLSKDEHPELYNLVMEL